MQKPDYFALLGLRQSFDIDLTELTQNYFKAQKSAHPDKSGENTEAALLNEAYGVLKNRFKRLGYLVETFSSKELAAPQDLLMEIMELREEYEAEPEPSGKKIKQLIEDLFAAARLDFEANKVDDMAEKYVRIKYLNNVIANT